MLEVIIFLLEKFAIVGVLLLERHKFNRKVRIIIRRYNIIYNNIITRSSLGVRKCPFASGLLIGSNEFIFVIEFYLNIVHCSI